MEFLRPLNHLILFLVQTNKVLLIKNLAMKLATSIFVLLSFFSTYAQSVKIGEQEWMTQNLEVTQFNNGDPIPQAQSNEEWEVAGFNQKPAWCYVTTYAEENEVIIKQYGKLYNSFAINDPRGMVPEGWRISTVDDWFVLQQQLEQMNLSIQDVLTNESWGTLSGTDKLGLHISPGGWRDVGCGGVGTDVTFWCEKSEVEEGDEQVYTKSVSIGFYDDGSAYVNPSETGWIMGYYVRCLKK